MVLKTAKNLTFHILWFIYGFLKKGQIMSISNRHPVSAFQVADYFLRKIDYSAGESITNLKLQKLCYFAQVMSLCPQDRSSPTGQILFEDRIEAWAHGPVIPILYRQFKKYRWLGIDPVAEINDKNIINNHEVINLLDAVWHRYGHKTARALEKETHCHDPWMHAYGDRPPGQACNNEITPEAIKDFYVKHSFGRAAWQNNADVQDNHF